VATVAAIWPGGKTLPPFQMAVTGLPPCETAAGSCRQFKRRFEASFDKVRNGYLFSENRPKNKKIMGVRDSHENNYFPEGERTPKIII
jgi:hypothetical protein